ncbi:MAG TPA: LuxR C-terminal-related transcriptional regulator [Solirubrobacteraceae bacterium]|nr:LuxR C-terminal-related transcriptional regulator [Solirubrobacteraceae bacterium]
MSESTGSGRGTAAEEPEGLTRIRRLLAEAALGEGRVVYVEGESGADKAQLVMAAGDAARAGGMRVLQAQGRALEREFPFGVAIQLFEEAWFATRAGEREGVLQSPGRPAAELLSGAPPADPGLALERTYAIIHGLFWLARKWASGVASAGPLALIVDDVDCTDGPSLRFLAYLASRIGKLPIAVVVGARPDQPSADPPSLRALRSSSELLMLSPAGSSSGMREPGPRAVSAQAALGKSLAEGHRESVIELAELAWGDGALLDSDADADAWPAVAGSLLFVDELERAVEIAQTAARSGRAVHSHSCHGWSLYHQGEITGALAVAQTARAADRDDRVARGVIAACRLAQGRLEEAAAALPVLSQDEGIDPIAIPVLLDVRAQLRLAQLRFADALEDALEAGRRSQGPSGLMSPGIVAWRSTAALARLALGETARARALAEEELELARTRGVARVVIRDMRVLAFAAKGARSLDLLAEAVRVGRAAPPRLEYVNALVDLGAAMRRANQRTAARHPLRTGLELAERRGAEALARRARDELGATGARSRKVMLSGINALTPSERRVADLAAGGLTTRQIAHALFVSSKTVEFHLRHVYRKLDIPSSRAELARALSPTSG